MGRDQRLMQMATVWIFFGKTLRSVKAAKRFLQRLAAHFGKPKPAITDKIERDIKAIKQLSWDADHHAHQRLNTVTEVSYPPPCTIDKIFGQFKSHRQAQ